MKLKKYICMLGVVLVASCTTLDLPPKNFISERDIFGSTEGTMSYISRMYTAIPMEDFRYYFFSSGLFFKSERIWRQQHCLTGEAIGRDTRATDIEHASYWDHAYQLIRTANVLIETLPQYASSHSELDMKTYIGEAYFIRAYTYYTLAKRYGGVPLIDKVLNYPAEVGVEGLKLPRNSEEDTWGMIADDLDLAMEYLPETTQTGRANMYVAAALKSRTMLHAGSIAKYNTVNEVYNNVRICGIPSACANDYFKAAYEASKIVDGGAYGLYKGQWVAGNKTAQYTNFVNIFLNDTNENIFVRYYQDPDSRHDFDCDVQPMQTSTGGNNSEVCPTLDFVEMFEGFDKNPDGTFKNFDAGGKYLLFDSPYDAFANCEPRLRATVILPMDIYRNETIELRRGIYKGPAAGGIDPLISVPLPPNYVAHNVPDLYLAGGFGSNAAIDIGGGKTMTPAGKSGIVSEWDYGNISGFYLRKYLDPTLTNNSTSKSTQSWIELRYAEVLLNRAEAAYELHSDGITTSESGDNLLSAAFECINQIRNRAGATELASTADLNDIDIVRTERRKELAFEHKTYWDLKRWRILDVEQNNRRYRTLNSFYSTETQKYFLDIRYQEVRERIDYIYQYDPRNYYQQIPAGEVTKNPNCKQNPGY